jgi:hypothetical protein
MRRLIFSLLVFCSFNTLANIREEVAFTESMVITPIEVNRYHDDQFTISMVGLPDYIDRQEKVEVCMVEYIRRQSKSYAKIVQNNLYDMIHNFDRIASKIYGKKSEQDEISYEDKIEALARVQCEAYYTMGVLK